MNIVQLIKNRAKKTPSQKAVVIQSGRDKFGRASFSHLTYKKLDQDSDFIARELIKFGVKEKSLCLLFVKPSLEFSLLAFALFKIGAVPILIDPGMGKKNLLKSVREVKPDILIAEPIVHYLKVLYSKSFSSVSLAINTRGFCFNACGLKKFMPKSTQIDVPEFIPYSCADEDMAAIIYTSGGTGAPKGVVYSHGIFASQVELLKDMFSLNENDIDMPAFPLFSLMTIAMGVTSVIPPMDPSKPSKADPALLVETIMSQGVTTAGGSPAIWERVGDYCLNKNISLASMRALMMFGAPVALPILENFSKVLPNGDTYTPYGATECLPLTCITGSYILSQTADLQKSGKGTCVGRAVKNTYIKIISQKDEAIENLDQCHELKAGEIGEILVHGEQVTKRYHLLPKETMFAKVYDNQGRTWHRMGDMGYLDNDGKLWFCGRVSHMIQSKLGAHYSVPCEAIFNSHPKIRRSALISSPLNEKSNPSKVKVCLAIERFDSQNQLTSNEKVQFKNELKALARSKKHTEMIDTFFLCENFPVDTRHNIKIDRIAISKGLSKNYHEAVL